MGELYLPSSLVEELAAERAAERAQRYDDAITFHETSLRVGGLQGSAGSRFTEESLLSEIRGWVAIGLRPITDRLASLDLRAHAAVDDTEDDPELPQGHPANAIIQNPNPIFTMADMLGLVGAWVKMTGNGYFQVLHDAMGVPRELWPMPPHRVDPVPGAKDVISGYIVTATNGREIPLEPREVVRIWRPDPLQLYQSTGDLAPQASIYNAETFRVGSVEEDFRNDSTPRTIFETSSDTPALTPDQRDAFRDTWREINHRRKGKGRGIPAIAPPGFSVHEMGRNADAAGTALLGDKAKEQLLAAMGTPGSIAGMVVDVNRAAAEANRAVFDRNTILPIANRIERSFDQQLAPQFDAGIVYRFQPFQDPDKDFDLVQEQSDLDRKVRTINEIREKRGMDPVPYGEDPVGSFSDVPYTGEVDFGLESESDLDDDGRGSPPTTRTINRGVSKAIRDQFSPEAQWRRMVANERKFTGKFTKAMARVFAEQRRIAIERLEKAIPEPRIGADDVFNPDEFVRLFRVEIFDLQQEIFRTNAVKTFGIINPEAEFIFNEIVVQRLEQMHAEMVQQVNATTRRKIARALVEGTAAGESVDQLAKRMGPVISNRKRARTIARTEVGKASQMAQLESFAQSQVVERKMWNTSLDEFVRDSHVATEGQIVDLEESFTLGSGARASFPLDPSLPAADLINCRCFVTPVFVAETGEEE